MISESDFIRVSYTPDMTQVGIKYACKSLPNTYERKGADHFHRHRHIVAEKAVELAFKRLLNNSEVPHNMLGSTPFTDPDYYDIALGGRRCDIKSSLLIKKSLIQTVRKEPHQLLNAQALVPVDQMVGDSLNDHDIYIFAFLTALITPDQQSIKNPLNAKQPIYLIHAFPKSWEYPHNQGSLGRVVFKSNMTVPIKLELGGQDENHKFQIENLILNPQIRTILKQYFSTISYCYTSVMPKEFIGVNSSALNHTHLIAPHSWGNIWVYGMEVIFVGYITYGDFRKKSTRFYKGSRIFQYPYTPIDNFSIPIQDLHPINNLFRQSKVWFHDQNN